MGETEHRGPRGGETTVSRSGMIRKTFWFHKDEADALRVKAFEDHCPEAEIVRAALRKYLGIED